LRVVPVNVIFDRRYLYEGKTKCWIHKPRTYVYRLLSNQGEEGRPFNELMG